MATCPLSMYGEKAAHLTFTNTYIIPPLPLLPTTTPTLPPKATLCY